ncbi:MAG TPA: hypothetical protein VEG61_03185 [Candidatus Dormibacteraeota bacterium]|nr:hypothetical protein [Candidatus Dormibacteraeota bacterium]
MFRLGLLGVSRRRAVGTLIGGLIILTLILTALGMMVFVSQQYDQYQQAVNQMAHYQVQAQSANLVANYPGLVYNAAWSGCGGCNMYNMSLSNLGGVGVQIVRIYINSTGVAGSGCSSPNLQPCILNPLLTTPTSTSTGFKQSTQFLNAGEVNHAVLLYLPSNIVLPASSGLQNTIFIATSGGNVFSFQWPFQIQMGGQSQFAFSAGIVRAAYQGSSPGYDSKNEPGPVAGGSGGTVTSGYCHSEPVSVPAYPPGASNSEKVSGVKVGGSLIGDGGILWFVNPWVTQSILLTAANGPTGNTTTLYLAVNITNTGSMNYTVVGGTLDLTWYGSNHIDASLIGVYYNASKATGPTFYSTNAATPQQIAPGRSFQGIYRVTTLQLNTGGDWPPATSVMFWGSAALTNNSEKTFVGGVSLSSGLWIPTSC